MMQLSANFELTEFLVSQTAERSGGAMYNVQQNPDQQILDNLETLVDDALQPLRTLLMTLFRISSGYRCKLLNEKIGGSKESQHCKGEAADVVLSPTLFSRERGQRVARILDSKIQREVSLTPRDDVNASFYLFAAACLYAEDCNADQIIHEYGSEGRPGWVHISVGGRKRRQILVINRDGTRSANLQQALALGC